MAKAGAARVFFDIVGTFQAKTLLGDTQAALTVQQAILGDALSGISDAFNDSATQIIDATQLVVDAFFEYEQQLIRVRKFYQGQAGEVERFAESTVQLGLAFGFSGDQALAASAKTAQLKQVLESQEAIIEATRGGLLMAAVGEMETEMGMNRLIQLAQQTGFMMGGLTDAQYELMTAEQQANIVRGNTIRVLDQLNTVENSSVAIMEDITFVLNQFSSQASIAGESIGEMAAMSALLLETGEEVSRAGTGLRMIYQRIGNENTEAVKVLSDLIDGVDATGITQMKLTDIIKEIGPAYDSMTAEQKRNLAVAIAGSRHYVKFLKLMENQPRLIELQTAAYHGQFSALEEFGLRAETASFRQQQLEAVVTNLQIEIGDKLTDSYRKAAEGQAIFLKGIDAIMETDMGGKAIGNLVAMSAQYQTMIQPLADVGFSIFNLMIAFKTLDAVRKASNPQFYAEAQGYAATREEIKFLTTAKQNMAITDKENLVHLQGLTYRNQLFGDETFKATQKLGALNQESLEARLEMQSLKATMTAMNKSLELGATAAGKMQNAFNTLTGQTVIFDEAGIKQLEVDIEKLNGEIKELTVATELQEQAQKRFINLNEGSFSAVAHYNALQSQGTKGMIQRAKAQDALAMTQEREIAYLSQTLTLTNPLNEAELQLARTKVAELNTAIQREGIKKGAIQSEIARLRLIDQEDKELNELLITYEKEEEALMKKRNAIQMDILASEQSTAALKKRNMQIRQEAIGVNASRGAIIKYNFAMAAAGISVQGVTKAMMPLSMLFMLVGDGASQAGIMAVMLATMAFPMLMSAMTALNVAMAEGVFLQTILTGGMNLLIAAAVMAGAYFGGKALFGGKDFLADEIAQIDSFNEGIMNTNTNLASLSSREGSILEGVVDETYADIIATNGAADAIARLDLELADLNESKNLAGSNDNLVNQLEADISAATAAKSTLEGLQASQIELSRTSAILTAGGLEMTEDQSITSRPSYFGKHYRGEIVTTKERLSYTNLQGKFIQEEFDTIEQRDARKLELQEEYNITALMQHEDYLNALLGTTLANNEELIAAEKAANEEILGDAFQFANAREELFFGQRQNFTGTLMKQVSQGGIENLLHKTEIVQTNIFNGMTLPEMVTQVSQGVLDELRSGGLVA
jgi:TP901 family phage tail tape measure protein